MVFLARLSRRLKGEPKVYEGIRRPPVVRQSTFSNDISEADSFHISHVASIGRGTNNCVFCSGRIRILVAMVTCSSHRLIMGKEEIDNFFCPIGDIWIFFTEMSIE